MQLFLYKDTKENIVHASANQKVTGCRIKLKNATNFNQAGSRDFTDLIDFLDAVNCQKCQDAFSKKVLAADNKARREKANAAQKQAKNGYSEEDNNLVNLAEEQERKRNQSRSAFAPPSSASTLPPPPSASTLPPPVSSTPLPPPVQSSVNLPPPEAEQTPEPAPVVQAPELDDSALPKYEEWVPPTKKKEQAPASPAPSSGGLAVDDSLAAFMVNKTEDPTAAAFAADNSKNPNVLAEQSSAPATPENNLLDDTLSQFAIPGANTAPAQPTASASGLLDDTLSQFAIPGANTAPAQPTAPASGLLDDTLSQFAIPGANTAPAQPTAPASGLLDDTLSQFAIPGANTAPAQPT
ncbi:MAG: hypothetical protein E7496_11755, partial [Ruminococcus sp.]|nr:hypothetical protein [Ruminococcus sp.]